MNHQRRHFYYKSSISDYPYDVFGARDVLLDAIPGDRLWSRIRRWWWDLVLVCPADSRSHRLYSSTHAFIVERKRHYQNHRYKIHPYSKFRSFWDCLVLHLFMINIVLFHINTSIIYGDMSNLTYYVSAFIEIIVIVDMFVNVQTGYVAPKLNRVVLGTRKILFRYCTTDVFIHLASGIPAHWLMFLRYGSQFNCALCKSNRFIAALKFLSIFNLIRIYQSSEYWYRSRDSLRVTHYLRLLRLIVLALVTVYEICELTDVIVLHIMITNNHINDHSRHALNLKYKLNYPQEGYILFIYDVGRIFKSLFLFTIRRYEQTLVEKMSSLVTFVIAKLFFMALIVESYTYIAGEHYTEDRIMRCKRQALNLVRNKQLPDVVINKVKTFFHCNLSRVVVTENDSKMFYSSPKILIDEAFILMYGHYVSRIPYFKEWPNDIIEEIVLLLKEHIFLKNDLVVDPLLPAEGLYMVKHGELAVYSGGKETGHLIDGDYFGEISLVTNKETILTRVIAVTPCVILLLHKNQFRNFMRQHPALFFVMKDEIIRIYGYKYVINIKPEAIVELRKKHST